MVDLNKLTQLEARRWAAMHIDPKRKPEFMAVASRLVAPDAKARYVALQQRTGVPWWAIAVMHERECSQNWHGSLAQGDPIDRRSTHVPVGRPPGTWDEVAYDALVNCPPYAHRWRDWSIGGALVLLEEYNGLGYAAKGVPSPYDWSGSDQYTSGKYIRDHVYDQNAVDRQLGCAALIACMATLDTSIKFDGTAPVPTVPIDKPAPAPRDEPRLKAQDALKPSPSTKTPEAPKASPEPSKEVLGHTSYGWLSALIDAIFGRKATQ